MSGQLIKFDSGSGLPAYLANAAGAAAAINKDVATAAAFPTMSIRGKRFTIARDGIKKVLTKPGEDDEVAQNVGLIVLRANMNAKVFYLKKFQEGGDSENMRPDCYSMDGVAPSANAQNKQAAKCAICPQNVWGSRVGDNDDGTERKGRACADNARLAISAPDKMDPMLLRVPPASLKGLREAVKLINQRKIPYNSVVLKVGFDIEASSPKLTFKPIALLDEDAYTSASGLYDSEIVRAIVGVEDAGFEHDDTAKPSIDDAELAAAIAGHEAVAAAQTKAAAIAAKPAVKPAEAAPAPALKPAKPKPAPVTDDDIDELLAPKAAKPAAPLAAAPPAKSSAGNLMDDLDSLLGNKDD